MLRACSACLLSRCRPLERLKIEFQVQDVLYKDKSSAHRTEHSIIRGLKQIYAREGIVGMFKGNGANVLRILPYSSTQVRFAGTHRPDGPRLAVIAAAAAAAAAAPRALPRRPCRQQS